MSRDLVGRAIDAISVARLRPDVDRLLDQAVDRLHVGLLGLPDANLAEVEQRHLELDLEAARADAFAGLALDVGLGDAGNLEEIYESRRLRKPIGLGERIDLDARDLQIDPPPDRLDLDGRQASRPPRRRRQCGRQLEIELVPPKPEHPDQSLALAGRALTGGRKLGGDVGVKDLLARLVELVHGAGLSESLGQLAGGFGRALGLGEEAALLLRGNGPVVGAPGLGRDPQGLLGGAQLRLPETVGSDLGARRQRGERQDVRDDALLDLDLDRARQPLDLEQADWAAGSPRPSRLRRCRARCRRPADRDY